MLAEKNQDSPAFGTKTVVKKVTKTVYKTPTKTQKRTQKEADVTLASADVTARTIDNTPGDMTMDRTADKSILNTRPKTKGDHSYVLDRTVNKTLDMTARDVEVKEVFADAPPKFWNKDEGSVCLVRCGKGPITEQPTYISDLDPHNDNWSPDVEDYRTRHAQVVCDAYQIYDMSKRYSDAAKMKRKIVPGQKRALKKDDEHVFQRHSTYKQYVTNWRPSTAKKVRKEETMVKEAVARAVSRRVRKVPELKCTSCGYAPRVPNTYFLKEKQYPKDLVGLNVDEINRLAHTAKRDIMEQQMIIQKEICLSRKMKECYCHPVRRTLQFAQ